MIEQARGEAFCRWDDDDISLPWRLSLSVEKLGQRLEWHPSNYWYCPASGPQEDRSHGNDHIQALFTKRLLNMLGGYPDTPWSGYEDQAFHGAMRAAGVPCEGEQLPTGQMFYLYRWGVSAHHLSGTGGEVKMQTFYDELGKRPIVGGTFQIWPHWRSEYARQLYRDTWQPIEPPPGYTRGQYTREMPLCGEDL